MKIRITEKEIAQILLAAVTANISFKTGSEPDIKFTATRGDEGIVAEIDVPYMGVGGLDFTTSKTVDSPAQPEVTPVTAVEPGAATAPEPKTRAPRGSRTAGKTLFGDLTKTTAEPQDAPAEQTNDGQAAAADDEPPFAVTDTPQGEPEAATDSGTEGAAEQAETPTPPKGKSLFDK